MSTNYRHPMFLLTDNDYNALGAVAFHQCRWLGHDTAGEKLFNRKDITGAQDAAKKMGARLVTTSYYGVELGSTPAHPQAIPAPENMADRRFFKTHDYRTGATKSTVHGAADCPRTEGLHPDWHVKRATAREVMGAWLRNERRVDKLALCTECLPDHPVPAVEPEPKAAGKSETPERRLVARRIPEVGCAVYDQDTGEKVSPPGDAWWPNMRRANQARTDMLAALARRVEGYAAKFAAETISAEPPRHVEPTDGNLAATFAGCGRVPPVEEYPAIREAFVRLYAENAAEPEPAADGELSPEAARRAVEADQDSPIRVAIREAAAGLAARPGLVDDLTGAQVLGTDAVHLSTGTIREVDAVTNLTGEQIGALGRVRRRQEKPPADAATVAVLALPFDRALAIGVFANPAAARLWWDRPLNKMRGKASLVLRPADGPEPASFPPAAAAPADEPDPWGAVLF